MYTVQYTIRTLYSILYVHCTYINVLQIADPSPSVCGTEEPGETDEDQVESNPEQRFMNPEHKTEPGVYDKEMETLQKLFPQKPKVGDFIN